MNRSRRTLLLGGLAAGAAALALRPSDSGANHNQYFKDSSKALDDAGISRPTLVIDKKILLANIETLRSHINGRSDYRIVAKSLPSLPLLKTVMTAADTNKLMMFHQPFMNQVANEFPESDLLLGKPMPVQAAQNFYTGHSNPNFDPEIQLQWLVDAPQRLEQYRQLAASLQKKMRINLELDVGLHRGGVNNDEDLSAMLTLIEQDPWLSFSGFMGYEPHIAKVPGNKIALRDKAQAIYRQRVETAERVLGRSIRDLTLNTGGSPTYQFYDKGDFIHNELAAGSSLIKPTDFDLDSLNDHRAGVFIATPVVKTSGRTEIPGVSGLGSAMALWNPNRERTVFAYGGYWKAKPHSPQGLVANPVFGRSTNQELYNHSKSVNLNIDDWLFFRPTQSEFVLLQFGDIAVMDNGRVSEIWPVLQAS